MLILGHCGNQYNSYINYNYVCVSVRRKKKVNERDGRRMKSRDVWAPRVHRSCSYKPGRLSDGIAAIPCPYEGFYRDVSISVFLIAAGLIFSSTHGLIKLYCSILPSCNKVIGLDYLRKF